jgi:hypothetical protein
MPFVRNLEPNTKWSTAATRKADAGKPSPYAGTMGRRKHIMGP